MTIIIVSIYILFSFFIYKNSVEYPNYIHFIRNIRYILYLALLVIIGELLITNEFKTPKKIKPSGFIIFNVLLFLLVYLFEILILKNNRPRLYSENNFEMPGLLILTSGLFYTKIFTVRLVFLSTIITLLSLSKSALLQAVFLCGKIVMGYKSPLKPIILPVAGILMISMGLIVSNARDEGRGVEKVDRYIFTDNFTAAMEYTSTTKFLFGHGIAAQLPSWSCSEMEFWATQIEGDYRICTATVYHSFLLKLFFETGVLGGILTLWLWLYFLIKYLGKDIGISAFAIIFLCSISVSGFGNSIVIWPVYFLITLIHFYKIGRV